MSHPLSIWLWLVVLAVVFQTGLVAVAVLVGSGRELAYLLRQARLTL